MSDVVATSLVFPFADAHESVTVAVAVYGDDSIGPESEIQSTWYVSFAWALPTSLAEMFCGGAATPCVPSDHVIVSTFVFDGLEDRSETRMSTETDG